MRRIPLSPRSRSAALALLAALCLCGGCSRYMQGFFNDEREPVGDLVKATLAKQVVNPVASAPTEPVTGISGPNAASAMGRHREMGKADSSGSNVTLELIGAKKKN